jgi:simple sugar transport system ATP-binding protein
MSAETMRSLDIEAIGITKRFGTFTALSKVSLKVKAGTVHALLGENGAGKSTLVKCLLGYYRADEGSFLVNDHEVAIGHPRDADRLGLGMVYQHFTLVPSMTLAENLVMARSDVPRVIDWRQERERLAAFVQRMPFGIPLDLPVGALAAGERQKAEILKQLYLERRLLVLDEPTSALTPQEGEEVLGFVRQVAVVGEITAVIISHKLKEVAAFADHVTVLRRGAVVGDGPVGSLSARDLAALMIGEAQPPAKLERTGTPDERPGLTVTALASAGDQGRPGLSIGKLEVRPREIVGIAGVSGNGQRDLVEVLGGQRRATKGTVHVSDRPYKPRRKEALTHKVRILPEEPLRNACVPQMTVVENLGLRHFDHDRGGQKRLWLNRSNLAVRADAMIRAFGIRTPSPQAPIAALSGGNVQRAVLARELDGEVDILVVSNPCFGLDVKAVAEIRSRIVAARNAGAAVLLLSEDLDEILELSDRIAVMREGKLVYEVPGPLADPHIIGQHMVGHA